MTLTAAVMFQLTVTMSTVTTSLYWLGDLTVIHNVCPPTTQKENEEEKKG
jgi:hypothetical protein